MMQIFVVIDLKMEQLLDRLFDAYTFNTFKTSYGGLYRFTILLFRHVDYQENTFPDLFRID